MLPSLFKDLFLFACVCLCVCRFICIYPCACMCSSLRTTYWVITFLTSCLWVSFSCYFCLWAVNANFQLILLSRSPISGCQCSCWNDSCKQLYPGLKLPLLGLCYPHSSPASYLIAFHVHFLTHLRTVQGGWRVLCSQLRQKRTTESNS